MTEAIAQAAEVPAEEVRRAHQLGGSLTEVARAALGGTGLAALRGFSLQIGHPVRPMLAASAPDVAAALERVSPAAAGVEDRRHPDSGAQGPRQGHGIHQDA